MQSSWNNNRGASDICISDPAPIPLAAVRRHEQPGVTSGCLRGLRFALLIITPFYLLGIYLWLR